MEILGPYIGKDNRLRAIIKDSDGEYHTVSWPKYLVEQHIGRKLTKTEQVHHKDGNPLNNDLENLEVVFIGKHQKEHRKPNIKPDIESVCCWCNQKIIMRYRRYYGMIAKGNKGPFCSRQCSGKYGASIKYLGK